MEKKILGDIVGDSFDDEFMQFDFTEIQVILDSLKNEDSIDVAHCELLQQQALRGADILSEYLGKLVKITSYLDSKINSVKNRVSLEYKSPDGKTTADQRKAVGEASPEVEDLSIKLAKAKGSKAVLEKKYDILIRAHHFYKDVGAGMKKGMVTNW